VDTIQRWKQERRLFIVSITILSLIFYLTLPLLLTVIPEAMNKPAIGGLSLAWVYAFFQVVMTWLIGWIYWIKAKHLDKLVAQMKQEEAE